MSDLSALEQRARAELTACGDEAALRAWHSKYFGKSGEVLASMDRLKSLPPAEKPTYGKEVNRIKTALTEAYEATLSRPRSWM
jgi:phenylalanyl-tRNA synthetase alpha chain